MKLRYKSDLEQGRVEFRMTGLYFAPAPDAVIGRTNYCGFQPLIM